MAPIFFPLDSPGQLVRETRRVEQEDLAGNGTAEDEPLAIIKHLCDVPASQDKLEF
jgi:hypothetical protein